MKRTLIGLFGGFIGTLCAMTLVAAEPAPLLDFDFAKCSGGIVKDNANSGISIQVGDAVKNGALNLKAGDNFTPVDQAAFREWASKVNMREVSVSFWIRFDKKVNAAKACLGFVDCYIAKDGTFRLAMFAPPTELLDDRLVVATKLSVETGKWYHVEFSYSANSRRYSLYIDGKYQADNDKLLLPALQFGELKFGDGFCGAVKDIKFYDVALPSEEMAIASASAADYDALTAKVTAAAAKATNPNIKAWAAQIGKRISEGKYAIGKTTIAAFKRLKEDTEKLVTLNDALLAKPQDTVSDQIVTVYNVPATTQDLYLPYKLPVSGELSNKIDLFMAQDEYETASILVVPFAPVKNFTVRMNNLTNGRNTLKGSDVDIKLVKRWFRTGGAWATYHVDLRMRVLTPDMLLNDDKLVRVDEWRRTNEVRMNYPGGTRYENVSDFQYGREWLDKCTAWFQDAPVLQPMDLPEAGKNQQFMITFHTPKGTDPGFYTGWLEFWANGRTAGRMFVTIRVLPFELPQPMSYQDVTSTYLSHVNHHDGSDISMINGLKFNMRNLANVANNPKLLAQAIRLGYPLKDIFADINTDLLPIGCPPDKETPELQAQQDKILTAKTKRLEKMIADATGTTDFTLYRCASSEAAWYGAISVNPEHSANVLHETTNVKYFSHGMTRDIPIFSPGIYDMDSNVAKKKEYSDIWHATGGKTITYAAPFPGPENPGLMRRVMGLELYKAVQYDGHMMHGYIAHHLNEFSKYPGGDGDYRTFAMCYIQKDGLINRVSIIGYREGFDDVRYATALKIQALKYRDVKDQVIAREAKRQLAWLERVDGYNYDLDAFRSECAYRILVLQELVQSRIGKGK